MSHEMQALGKRKRGDAAAAADVAPAGGDDRLSSLPDCLLHEIMSRMKARQMVQTCALSRRWRHLWSTVPCLDVDQREFAAAGLGYDKFDDFVFFLLVSASAMYAAGDDESSKLPIASLLDAFQLHVISTTFDTVVESASAWIRRAIINSSSGGSWPLKRLHLTNLRLDARFAEHVRAGCPRLEELELRDCTCVFHAIASGSLESLALRHCSSKGLCEITSPSLKSLVIENGGSINDVTSQLVVSAPALACLSLVATPFNFPCGVSFLHEMASLAKASIHLKGYGTLERIKEHRGHLFEILRSVSSSVATLELSGFDMKLVQGDEESTTLLPEFKNLRTLELSRCALGNDLQVPGHILRNSPNLEKLILSRSWWKVLGGESHYYQEFKNIRVLILDNYDLSDVSQALGYFLQSSPILEKLTLRCCKFSNDTKKKRGTSKIKNIIPNLVDVRCENLKLTEIIYKDDDVSQLAEFLLRFARNLPNNNIRLTKID